MTTDLKRRLRAACEELHAQTAGLEAILRDPDRHPARKFQLQQARVIVALSRVIELRVLALCPDTAVKG